jgi:hypothetical protein
MKAELQFRWNAIAHHAASTATAQFVVARAARSSKET